MSNDMTEVKNAEMAKGIRGWLNNVQVMHLDQVEHRLADHRQQAAEGLMGIGRDLVEAKDAGLVQHGYWADWVKAQTGLDTRTAQRVMQAARETANAPALTHLGVTKVLSLLRLPADQREDFAREVGAEGLSARKLEEAVKARLAAEQRAKEAEISQKYAEAQWSKAAEAVSRMNSKVEQMQKLLDQKPEAVTEIREVVPDDYAALKQRDTDAARRIQEADDYADRQEARVRELEQELDALRDGQGAAASPAGETQAFIQACSDFFGTVCRWQNMTDGELLQGRSQADMESMRMWVRMIEGWASTLDARLDFSVIGGDGHVR